MTSRAGGFLLQLITVTYILLMKEKKKKKTDKTYTEKQGHMQRAVADNNKCPLW